MYIYWFKCVFSDINSCLHSLTDKYLCYFNKHNNHFMIQKIIKSKYSIKTSTVTELKKKEWLAMSTLIHFDWCWYIVSELFVGVQNVPNRAMEAWPTTTSSSQPWRLPPDLSLHPKTDHLHTTKSSENYRRLRNADRYTTYSIVS